MNRTLVAALLASACLIPSLTQTAQAQSWDFTPRYDLPRNAGPAREKTTASVSTLAPASTPLRFNGMTSTDSRTLQAAFDSARDFTIELWMLDHVNRPVGAVVSPVGPSAGSSWLLGYTDGQAVFGPARTAMSKVADYKEDRERRSPGFRARQAAWLDQALARSTARWKIAMHHHDLFTSDDDDYGDSWRARSTNGDETMRGEFASIYERHGVDLVIYGHLHAYERTWPMRQGAVDLERGVTYLQVGGMGGNPEDFALNKPVSSAKTARTHHYVMLRGAGDRIDIEMVDIEGRTRDRFALTK